METKSLSQMSADEIITKFLEERGVDVTDPKLRKEYPPGLVERARHGDSGAVISLLKIGTHFSTGSIWRQRAVPSRE